MGSILVVIEITAIFLIFVALGLLLFGKESKEQKLMVYFIGASLIQNCGYLLEYMAQTPDSAITAIKVQYLGSVFIPILYCWFIYCYCREKVPVRFFRILMAIDNVLLLVVFTCDKHTLYYRQLDWLVTDQGHHYMRISYGPGYLVFLGCSCIIPYVLSFYMLFRATVIRPQEAKKRNYKLILFLSALPIVALILYILKFTSVFDFTPASLGIVLSLVVIADWSRRVYDFRTLASEVVLNSMGDGVISLDDQKQIVGYNPASTAIFPGLDENAIGKSVFSVMQDLPEGILKENEKSEFCIGDRYYEGHVKKIVGQNMEDQGYVILLFDITETKRNIEEIKRVREQAERANLVKSEFLANMSHEIRTPMNAIVGLSDIIMEESRGQKVYSYANDIKSASHNLLNIINDILDLSKVEAGKMELILTEYYIKGMVNSVTTIMDINASLHNLELQCEFDAQIPCQYYGDEGRIRQILINLLNNAVKFTKEGYVKLSVSGTPAQDGVEDLVFCVEDTGCGIKEEDIGKIFEDFKQVDSKRNRTVEGTGLGLSITKHLIALMNGTITVQSVYGMGTVFTVTIPQKIVDSRTLEEMPDVPDEEKDKDRLFHIRREYKVLIVDDNAVNRKVAVGFLKGYGFTLMEAESGADAIAQVEKTRFDIIFMDHMMPEMDGVEAVRHIRSQCGENGTSPVIIALTANAMEGVQKLFRENGFEDFLAKPLYRKTIHEMLMKWIPEEDKIYEEEDGEEAPEAKDESRILDFIIPGIDVEQAKKHHGENLSNYIELLVLYDKEGRRKTKYFRELIETEQYELYGIEVHGLKSASANMGAMTLSAMARAHEDAVRDGDLDYVRSYFEELMTCYETLLSTIERFLESAGYGETASDETAKEVISKEDLLKGIQEALGLLEDFHSRECSARIEQLLSCQLEEPVRADLSEILEQLRLYEDDRAEELLRAQVSRMQEQMERRDGD